MLLLALLAVVALIAVNAVFVATEFALVASRPVLLEEAAGEGLRGAALASRARSDLRRQLSGAQLLITVSSVLLGVIAEPAVGRLVEPVLGVVGLPAGVAGSAGLVAAIASAAVLQMLLGELVPKNLAIADPERALRVLAPVHRVVIAALAPAIWALDRLASLAVMPFGHEPVDEVEQAIGAPELAVILEVSRREGLIEGFRHDLLSGALDLGSRPVSSVMVPIEAVVVVDRGASVARMEQLVVESGHSRLPVRASSGGQLLGMVHVKDLLRLPAAAQHEPVPLELIRRMLVVGADEPLDSTLRRMRSARSHLAVVSADDGETVGIVAMEDVVEELVGDIRDEHDAPGT